MKGRNDEELIFDLKQSLKDVETVYEVEIPEHFQLMNTLIEYKKERKRAQRRELIIFIFTAIIILAFYMTLAFKLTSVFMLLQIFTLCFMPIAFIFERKRRNKREEVSLR
ncbi:DUF5345 family protein [Metabacillus niabensis]|uniref:Flp pilus assembly protein TadB n=1 Tax=Metabacillus niabensis TaxID=324854 RepID=A0ABT9Z7F3_9BACI|nr:DUF5345 family protein [Metabacillus niabensis]MDQ0228189.1 Flp pilus assembly protein TadB [Metabacillus niabensis]PAD68960.1 hypothetical protein CHH83_11105 [Bacillus sp. 7586-K]